MQIINLWLMTYSKKLENSLNMLEEYHMKGSYGGNLNLVEIMTLLSTAKNEIIRLQIENDNYKNLISKLNCEIKKGGG